MFTDFVFNNFFENYVTSEGAVSRMFYVKQHPIARYKISFYASRYFE